MHIRLWRYNNFGIKSGKKNISPYVPFYISDEGRWRKEG